jgi:hypothetical protein
MWAVLDRFFWNLYPMAVNFKPLSVSLVANGVYVPSSVWLFDIFGRITGRALLVSFNFLFWTECKTLESFLMQRCNFYWLDLRNLPAVNKRAHTICGWFCAVPLVLHIAFAFVPSFAGFPLVVGRIRPPTRVTPFIFNNNGVAQIWMSYDDVFRAALVFALVVVVLPLTYLKRRGYPLASLWVHIMAGLLLTIDHLRRSPHGQIFNSPVVVLWITDWIVGLIRSRWAKDDVEADQTRGVDNERF